MSTLKLSWKNKSPTITAVNIPATEVQILLNPTGKCRLLWYLNQTPIAAKNHAGIR